jgi:virulence-associated protein VapD
VFAIAYDFDTDVMKAHLGEASYANGYTKFKDFMRRRGFNGQQGSLLYGESWASSVHACRAIQDATSHFPWLKDAVKDIRLLEVDRNDDLSLFL